jgi:hypothetical protein
MVFQMLCLSPRLILRGKTYKISRDGCHLQAKRARRPYQLFLDGNRTHMNSGYTVLKGKNRMVYLPTHNTQTSIAAKVGFQIF